MANEIAELFLDSIRYRFRGLKELGDKAMAQVGDGDLHWAPDGESNSIAVIVQHMHGNMMSRWTNFLTSDGEKLSRNRDAEFEPDAAMPRDEIMRRWEEGWACLFSAIDGLTPDDLLREVTIRGQALNVVDAIERQVVHYAYHAGQIVYIARHCAGATWQSLSVPRGKSSAYRPVKRD